MFKLMWVPKKYKHYKFIEIVEEQERLTAQIEETLKKAKEANERAYKSIADSLVFQNSWSSFSKEEKEYNLRIIVSWCSKQLEDQEDNIS